MTEIPSDKYAPGNDAYDQAQTATDITTEVQAQLAQVYEARTANLIAYLDLDPGLPEPQRNRITNQIRERLGLPHRS